MKSEFNFCYKIENVDKVFSSSEDLYSYIESHPDSHKFLGNIVLVFCEYSPVAIYRIFFVGDSVILKSVNISLHI